MHTFSIIVPVKPGGHVAACQHINKNISADTNYEMLLAEGNAPSKQRNNAAREAGGDLLYFLDDDSLVKHENLVICSEAMNDPTVAVVGGPSLTPAGDSWLQQLFGYALASGFGSGAVSNRYRACGEVRKTTDKELILCNLVVRRSVFIELGGFNECLYPNEENEFLERVVAAGYTLLHVPAMSVFRSQRRTLKAFIRQMFSYGRGRGQQTLITSSYSVTSFIPLFFVIYLAVALIGIKYVLLLVPLVLYVFASLASAFMVMRRTGRIYALFLLGIYPLMHVVNGIGLLWGLLNGKPEPTRDIFIRISKIKEFGEKRSGQKE
jgi:GT2 family glycosyltransferase